MSTKPVTRSLLPVLALVTGLIGCTPTTRLITRRCPAPVSAVLNDTGLGLGVLALSALKWETNKEWESVGYTTAGLMLLTGVFVTELTCLK